MSRDLTQSEVLARVEGLEGSLRRSVVCALVGHSRVCSVYFVYRDCARCGETVGDALVVGDSGAAEAVILDHGCDDCRTNAKALGWRDLLLLPEAAREYVDGLLEGGSDG